jgi:hypothetical protein
MTANGMTAFLASEAPASRPSYSVRAGSEITIVDVASGRQRTLRGKEGQTVTCLAPSPDGRLLATGLTVGVKGKLPPLAKRVLGAVRLWEVASGKELALLSALQGSLNVIVWSSDSRLVAVGDQAPSSGGGSPPRSSLLHVWDAATATETARFELPARATALVFSPDGARVIAGLSDSTILVFDARRARRPLAARALGTEEVRARWTDLASDDAGTAYRAVADLAGTEQEAVPFLRSQLKPAKTVDAAAIEQWLVDLDNSTFAVREAAMAELQKLARRTRVPLETAATSARSLEVRRRIERILKDKFEGPDADTLRALRAIIALEQIGSPEAQDVLRTLSHGAAGAAETIESQSSLDRLAATHPRLR